MHGPRKSQHFPAKWKGTSDGEHAEEGKCSGILCRLIIAKNTTRSNMHITPNVIYQYCFSSMEHIFEFQIRGFDAIGDSEIGMKICKVTLRL